jgi:hypothetical protein
MTTSVNRGWSLSYFVSTWVQRVSGFFRFRKSLSSAAAAVHGEAMCWWTDPAKLTALADIFEKNGHPAEGADLRARATIANAQPKAPASHEDAVRRAIASDNPAAIRSVATAFQKSGKGATATFLNNVADGVEAAKEVN